MMHESFRNGMVRDCTRTTVQQSGGIAQITLDQLVAKLGKQARATVPATIEADIKEQIYAASFEQS